MSAADCNVLEPALTSWSPLRLTAAVPSKDRISVVTLSWNGKYLYLVPNKTSFFTMTSDDQLGVRQFAGSILDFFRLQEIEEILVRRGPSAGHYQASSGSTKIETILQLMPMTCAHVHVQRVTGWAKQQAWLLPLPQNGLGSSATKLQEQAIQTAAFGIACVLTDPKLDGCLDAMQPVVGGQN